MHEQLDDLLAARDQTEKLLHVILGITSDLDLNPTLDRIVTAAIELTGARYGALAVREPDGVLVSFLHQGIDAETMQRIGPLPVGKGVLGVPLENTLALRLDDLAAHPAAAGFPPHHPPMRAFLGVPITIRGNVFGSLYVTHEQPGRTFSESDEVAARVLASAAAVAIDNAQLFERVRTSATWTQASREITTALLSGAESPTRPLHLIAERALELTGAEQTIVLVPDSDRQPDELETLVVSAAVGLHADEVIGQRVPVDDSTSGAVFRSGEPVITEALQHPIQAFTDVDQRPGIVVPLRAEDAVLGVIAVARNKDDPAFDPSYLELVSDFARHAAIALTLARARSREREVTILADRERIAHDLHDHVIQRLFAAGLDLQGSIARSKSPELSDRLMRTVDDLQATIETIRSTIFDLQSPLATGDDFRTRFQKLVADLTGDRDIATTVRLSGPLGAVNGQLSDHAEAVTAEAISNAVRHSGAKHITVTATVGDEFSLEVTDDGHGIPADNQRSSGLANMSRRAELLGGTCEITSAPECGTKVQWTVPVFTE
ncbi:MULTISPECIES: GAF domain-containing sensor histidine kinase [unclassified Mycobacterium]|uniref:GAF domain-containing sensor histidine kinase n=1 Tax=unclassified Mycobacterium TaxID=2642494 RepID=UPI0029C66D3A|nr:MULTISPECIES: GAF domain-containing sensor histidine kinase [unclassified Mycobacterium]